MQMRYFPDFMGLNQIVFYYFKATQYMYVYVFKHLGRHVSTAPMTYHLTDYPHN